jgi:hypothetical protein
MEFVLRRHVHYTDGSDNTHVQLQRGSYNHSTDASKGIW